MLAEFKKNESARKLDMHLRKAWSVPQSSLVLFCSSTEMAIQEISKGLFSRFPHRLSAAIQEDIRPEFELVIPALSREAVKISKFSRNSIASDPQALVSGLGKLGLFVLTASKDPMTGQKNPVQPLAAKCVEARIPLICVDSAPLTWSPELQAGMALIIPVHPCLSILIAGEKVGFEPFASGNRLLATDTLDLNITPDAPSAVRAFESELPKGLVAPLKESEDRSWDRAVFCCQDVDGSALVDEIGRLQGRNLYEAGVLVGSACYWEHDLSTAWLVRSGWTAEQIQGLVVVPVQELNAFDSATLNRALERLKSLQG